MSAVGDYIHLMKENYIEHGVSRNGKSETVEQSYKRQHEENINKINSYKIGNENIKSIIEELKKRVSKNFNDSVQAKQIAENYGHFYKSVEDFQEKFREKLIEEVPKYVSNSNSIIKNIKNAQMNSNINFKELKDLRQKIINDINITNKNIELGKTADKTRLQSILDNTQLFFKKIGIIAKDNNFPSINLENQEITAALKAILLLAPLNFCSNSAFNGVLGEVVVGMASDKAEELVKKNIKEGLKEEAVKNIKGDIRSTFQIEEEQISNEVFRQEDTNYLFYAHSTQDKVDVTIDIKEQPLDISVKAYKAKGNIIKAHLQNITLLYSLVGTLGDFANHWISLHTYGMKDNDMDTVLKEQMAYEALIYGNILKKNSTGGANVFVAIDTKSGKVYASTTYDMITTNNGNTTSINLDNFSFRPNIGNIKINNKWDKNSPENRIAQIVKDLHKTKISVLYKASLNQNENT